MAWLLIAMTVAFQSDTTIVLGLTERDLTGDGSAETLVVIGVGRTIDDLNADFTIESAGTTVYRFKLQPLTRTVGFDAGRRVIQPRSIESGSMSLADGFSLKRSSATGGVRR